MFGDEAGFGRISTIRACWAPKGMRPLIESHHVREYRYLYGAVSPQDGSRFFITAGNCNTDWMNAFLNGLSEAYSDDYILLVLDNAAWHKSQALEVPDNIKLTFIPPYTPEMNPIEQIWNTLRIPFANKRFPTLKKVMDQLQNAVNSLTDEVIMSTTHRSWIPQIP